MIPKKTVDDSPALYLLRLDLVEFFPKLDGQRSTDEPTEVMRAWAGQLPTRLEWCFALVTDKDAVFYAFFHNRIHRMYFLRDVFDRLADPEGPHETSCFEVVPNMNSFQYRRFYGTFRNLHHYLEGEELMLLEKKVRQVEWDDFKVPFGVPVGQRLDARVEESQSK